MEKIDPEIQKSIRRACLLAKAFDVEASWLRDKLKPEPKRILNEAKAKVNHFRNTAYSNIGTNAKDIVDERGYGVLEDLMKLI
tara:strand:+ start:1551 stop:1799 length:249 start_codon:yes stop_codon:yes gene_type:complete